MSAEFDVRDDYVPHTHSDVKADVFSKPKSSLRTEDDRDRSANVGSKRNQPSSDVEQDNTKHDAEPDKVIAAIAAAAAAAASGTARPESGYMSQEFSELEDDAPQLRKKARRTTSKSAASTKRNATASSSKAGSGEAEQRLARLKKLVTECGVRKQWKKLYLDAGVSESDLRGQCNIVQGVLKDLGMTGKGSLEQAKKIRAQREFADELAALQENQVLHSARRQSSTRRGPTHTLTNANNAQNSSSQSTNLQHHSSFKKISRKIPLSDSDDSQDHPPAQTVSPHINLHLSPPHQSRILTLTSSLSFPTAPRRKPLNHPSQASPPTSTLTSIGAQRTSRRLCSNTKLSKHALIPA